MTSKAPVPRKILPVSQDRNIRNNKAIKNDGTYDDGDGVLDDGLSDEGDDVVGDGEVGHNDGGDPNLNLSNLIHSVERDIELLEQLEMNTGDHRGTLPLPVTSKLLGLPGYRPRDGHHHYIGNPDRRSSIETAKTTNPGYDALLCTRLYPEVPSTPPPLPRKTHGHRRTNSDSTLQKSQPHQDNPPTPASPSESLIAKKLSRHVLQQQKPIFCPFCLGHFYHPMEVQSHLVHQHTQELYQLKQDRSKHFKRETCPCCDAEFLKSGLGPHHLVHHHPQYVCNLMFGKPPSSPSLSSTNPHLLPATPPPERHSFCLLCGQRFLKKHTNLLALHLQQQHPKKFSQVMDSYFVKEKTLEKMQNPGVFDLKRAPSPLHNYELVDHQKLPVNDVMENGLIKQSLQHEKIKVKERNSNNKIPNVNKRIKMDSDNSLNKPPQRSKSSISFRRQVPLPLSSHETYHGLPQPEPPPVSVHGLESESCQAETREEENYYHYTDNSDQALFRCNLCGDRFTENDNLLQHLKTNHMAVSRALKAQFSCAKCPAKFFKNAFLLKHSLTHSIE